MITLGLERELIYSIKKHSIMSEIYINNFLDTESSESSFWYWLAKLASPNEIKDNPIWFSNWILENYSNHIDDLKKYWKYSSSDNCKIGRNECSGSKKNN